MSDPGQCRWDDEIVFRTLAAPGLEEDDLFAAMDAPPASGRLWGEGVPTAYAECEPEWDGERERQRRHEEILRRWSPVSQPASEARRTAVPPDRASQ